MSIFEQLIQAFIWMLKQSWFAFSPSPWSFAFYAILGFIGGRQLLREGVGAHYKRFPKLMAFVSAIFIMGIVVLIQDTIWLGINTWRWIIPLYMDRAMFGNYWVRFPQNLVGALAFLLLSWGEWKLKFVSFKMSTVFLFGMIALFTFAVFSLAPSQAVTDWVFAVRMGYPDQVILESFIISHVGYKILIALAFLSLFQWRHKDGQTQ